jgi:hypothetical protein
MVSSESRTRISPLTPSGVLAIALAGVKADWPETCGIVMLARTTALILLTARFSSTA